MSVLSIIEDYYSSEELVVEVNSGRPLMMGEVGKETGVDERYCMIPVGWI